MQQHPAGLELDSIQRELFIDASPTVVYDVISDPRQMTQWWADEATYEPVAGSAGTISFGDVATDGKLVNLTVVEAQPPTTFSFRWTHEGENGADAANSLLVTFELVPQRGGTLMRFVETGYRQRDWDDETRDATYRDHTSGWDHFLTRLASHAESQAARS